MSNGPSVYFTCINLVEEWFVWVCLVSVSRRGILRSREASFNVEHVGRRESFQNKNHGKWFLNSGTLIYKLCPMQDRKYWGEGFWGSSSAFASACRIFNLIQSISPQSTVMTNCCSSDALKKKKTINMINNINWSPAMLKPSHSPGIFHWPVGEKTVDQWSRGTATASILTEAQWNGVAPKLLHPCARSA